MAQRQSGVSKGSKGQQGKEAEEKMSSRVEKQWGREAVNQRITRAVE